MCCNLSSQAGTHILTYSPNDIKDDNFQSSVEDARRRGDPCFHYTVLDQTWRATNTTTKMKMCDRHVGWKGNRLHFLYM